MDMERWFASVTEAERPAFLAECYYPSVRLTGHGITETVNGTDAAAQAEVILAADAYVREMGAVFTAMDVTCDPEAWGCEVSYSDEAAPMTVSVVVRTIEDAQSIEIPGIHAGRQDFYLDVIKRCKAQVTDKPVFGVMMGPFSLAGMLMRYADAMSATVKQPELLQILLGKITVYLTARARAMKEAGADGVMIAEPSAGMIPPKHREKYSGVYVKEIVDAVQDETFFCALHNCGRIKADRCGDIRDTGVKILSVGNSSDIKALCTQMGPDMLVMGNLDPLMIANAPVSELREACESLLETMRGVPNFVFGPGCDLPPKTEPERLRILADCAGRV